MDSEDSEESGQKYKSLEEVYDDSAPVELKDLWREIGWESIDDNCTLDITLLDDDDNEMKAKWLESYARMIELLEKGDVTNNHISKLNSALTINLVALRKNHVVGGLTFENHEWGALINFYYLTRAEKDRRSLTLLLEKLKEQVATKYNAERLLYVALAEEEELFLYKEGFVKGTTDEIALVNDERLMVCLISKEYPYTCYKAVKEGKTWIQNRMDLYIEEAKKARDRHGYHDELEWLGLLILLGDDESISHEHYYKRSKCLERLGKLDAALEDSECCITKDPDWPKGYLRLGIINRKLEDFQSAAVAFKRGIDSISIGSKLHGKFRSEEKKLETLGWEIEDNCMLDMPVLGDRQNDAQSEAEWLESYANMITLMAEVNVSEDHINKIKTSPRKNLLAMRKNHVVGGITYEIHEWGCDNVCWINFFYLTKTEKDRRTLTPMIERLRRHTHSDRYLYIASDEEQKFLFEEGFTLGTKAEIPQSGEYKTNKTNEKIMECVFSQRSIRLETPEETDAWQESRIKLYKTEAKKARRNQKYHDELEWLSLLMHLDTDTEKNLENCKRRIKCHKRLGELEDALADANSYIQLAPDQPEGYKMASRISKKLNNHEEAAEFLKKYNKLKGGQSGH